MSIKMRMISTLGVCALLLLTIACRLENNETADSSAARGDAAAGEMNAVETPESTKTPEPTEAPNAGAWGGIETPEGNPAAEGVEESAEESAEASFQKGLERAQKMENSGNMEDASRAYQLLTTDFPNRWEPYHRLALLYERAQDTDAASALYDLALQRRPTEGSFFNDYGWYQLCVGNLENARNLLLNAVKMDDKNPKFKNNLAFCLAQMERYEEAFLMFRDAAGNSTDAYLNLAQVQYLQNKHQQARESVQKALTLSPNNEKAQELLSELEKSESSNAPTVPEAK
ncbi:MAG: tetratricopeptide repeat protein [Planctomycetia bacterium]|nr:tetratricopeptide repeat protein [Planctomycetia bacterium]